MADIVDINSRRNSPYLEGVAICMACRHEFAFLAPVGTTVVICPKCNCDAHSKGEILTEFEQWQCNCGYSLFRRDELSFYCPHCGERKD